MFFSRKRIVWSVIRCLCQRRTTPYNYRFSRCRGRSESDVATTRVSNTRNSVVGCLSLNRLCASRVSTQNNREIIFIKYLKGVRKYSGAAITTIANLGCGAANCHFMSPNGSLIYQNLASLESRLKLVQIVISRLYVY